MRGPLRWALNCGAQNRGEAPSPSLRSTSPRTRGEVKKRSPSRDAPSHPSFAFTLQESPSQSPPSKKGGRRSADKRIHRSPPRRRKTKPASVCGAHRRLPRNARDQSGGALAFRRPTAVMRRGFYPSTRLGPRFLELPDANGRTLSGASAASTSQSGHAPDGTMPRTARRRSVWLRFRGPLSLHFRKYPRERSLRERDG